MTVVDTAPPQIEATITPDCLWAPSHGMVLLRLGSEIAATASDACSGSAPTVYIKDVQSDQPEDGTADGHTAPDVMFGTGAACVRSEREGSAEARHPRTYTITLGARDESGNESTRTVTVKVPHDQSGGKCAKTPASLIVPEGDPRCIADLPGMAAPASPLPSDAAAEPEPAQESGCASTGEGVASLWAFCLVAALFAAGLRRRERE